MPIRSSAGNVKVNPVVEIEENRPMADPEIPFHVALLGDFSGRGNRGIVETGGALRNRPVYPIDRDNFSEVLSQPQSRTSYSHLRKRVSACHSPH